jgi:hypothetical protein
MNPHQVSVEAQSPQVTVTQSPVEVVVASRPVASVEITQAEPSITLTPEQISLTVSSPSIELTCQPTSFRSTLITLETHPVIEVLAAPPPQLAVTTGVQGPPGPPGDSAQGFTWMPTEPVREGDVPRFNGSTFTNYHETLLADGGNF